VSVVRLRPGVVVADDDDDILQLAGLSLRRAGITALPASDGLRALELARREAPDACVLDVSMPGLDGLEVTRRLREDPATRDLPVLLLSAAARPGDVEAGLAAGATDYLAKPFGIVELVDRIRRLLEASGGG
jgi:CheY-like chemotaxis protein